MKFKHKKLFISGTAVAAAGALGVGALLQSVLSVQASSEMMPGIETIVSENTEDDPFRILELVDSSENAEIGYYISGQEPSLKLYQYQYTDADGNTQTVHFFTIKDALSKLPEKYRTEFVMNVRLNDSGQIDESISTGIKKIRDAAGDDDDASQYPLSLSDYQEKYFLSDSDDTSDWTKVDLTDFDGNSRTDTVTVNGSYVENTAGTGDYTKGDQEYYPIRNDVYADKQQSEKFRENIQSFEESTSSDARGAYYLEFTEVLNTKINNALADENDKGQKSLLPEYDYANGRYGYYENVYTTLTKEIAEQIDNKDYQFPGEKPNKVDESKAVLVRDIPGEAVKTTSTVSDNSGFDGENGQAATDTENFGTESSGTEDSNSADFSTGTDAFESDGNDSSESSDEAASDSGSDSSDGITFDNSYANDESSGFSSDESGVDTQSFDGQLQFVQQSYVRTVEMSDADAFSDSDAFSDFESEISNDGSSSVDIQSDSGDEWNESSGATADADVSGQDATGTDSNADAVFQSILGDITNAQEAGSQADPYVYLGENIDQYPNYKYTMIGDLAYVKANAIDLAKNPNAELKDGSIVLDNDEYWYYQKVNGKLTRSEISVVTGRSAVPYNEIQEISSELSYNYYYRVSKVYFCCESNDAEGEDALPYSYFGWYYPNYPENQDVYLPVSDGEVATYYISEANYSLTPGTGNYDFTPGDDTAASVQVNSFYYQGGYTNNDWFKKYVFHLNPKADADSADGEFENFGIEVDTKLASDGTTTAYAPAVTGDSSPGNDTAANSAQDEEQAVVLEPEDAFGDDTTEQTDVSEEVLESDDTEDGAGEDETDIDVQENADESENIDAEDIAVEDGDMQEDEEDADVQAQDDEVRVSDSFADTLDNYDLIYVNGTLSSDVAAAIAATSIPCIVNGSRVNDTDAFSKFVRNDTEDADGHYVNMYMYFFKNTFAGTDGEYNLVNTSFHENFNSKSNSDENLTYGAADRMHGFEEIIKYINSENQYRELENEKSTDSELGDGSETDTSTQNIEPLDRQISQARAIEYIINYKYKRNTYTKQEINALEITPDGSALNLVDGNKDKLSEDQIMKWATGKDAESRKYTITVCCEENGNPKEKMLDGNRSTMWHSNWTEPQHSGVKHWLTVEFNGVDDVSGFRYQRRSGGSKNGILTDYSVQFWDKDGQPITLNDGSTTLKGSTGFTDTNYSQKTDVQAIEFSQQVKDVKRMTITFENTLADRIPDKGKFASCAQFGILDSYPEVTIKRMTASEFVGHIDDIASEYDLIYLDDYIDEGKDKSGKNLRNIFINGNSPMLYTHVGAARSIGDELRSGNSFYTKFLGQLDNDFVQTSSGERYQKDGKYYFAPLSSYSEDGAGYLRGSGNDMTNQQREELMEFVKSGYPVILSDNLVTDFGSVNKDTVDASSYYYQFMKEALNYDNVVVQRDLENGSKDIKFYSNLAKPKLVFDELPPEPERVNDKQAGQGLIEDGAMKYVFHIENDSDAAPAGSTYDCKLYIDLNFDGNLSKKEAQDKYISITDSKGNVLVQKDGRYQLKLGETYTLTRTLPSDYYKLITWKMVVSNNKNNYIHTSVQGYTKQDRGNNPKQDIKVLQIRPDKGGNWNLEGNATFNQYLAKVTDFNITIKGITVSEFSKLCSDAENREDAIYNWLTDYQILIIGFDDAYQNIPNDAGQVNAIERYIKSGRSVIFSHDTTSYLNYTYAKSAKHPETKSDVEPKIWEQEKFGGKGYEISYDNWLDGEAEKNVYNPSWGISLNRKLRSVVGMDRYGITSDKELSDGQTISSLLKQGHPLSSNEVSFADLMKYAGDIAYKSGDESRSSSYAQTQALTNGLLNGINLGGGAKTTQATKLNDGAITQYPYKISDSINVSGTHGQYYQLALEQDMDIAGKSDGENDIVVWYCLNGSIYSASPNDARNYYYYYSKGNVIYTGTGHSGINNNVNEMQLFVNSIVAAANVTAVRPVVSFVNSLNPAAETETSRYYMTDQTTWTSGEANTLEENMDFYINVKDYNMVSADLSQEDLDKQEMTIEFFIQSENGDVQSDSGSNDKLVNITSRISQLNGYNGEVVKPGADGKFHTTNNDAFGFTLNDVEQYLRAANGYKENCKLYVRISSTVYLYGVQNTSTVWSSIDLKQRQLFELD